MITEIESRRESALRNIVGKSETLHRVLTNVQTVAPTNSTVLIYGEAGTGKELMARALHDLSARRSNPFVKLNCVALTTGLLESELFGHEKGAFTGALASRIGRFELAHRGTILLDEIGEVPLEVQPKLLRVLQEREFERLGSTRTIRTDVRLIATTNRDLKAMVDEGRFRSDLYYRLSVFPIKIPALRERPEDILMLVNHFVQKFRNLSNRLIDTVAPQTMASLVRYSWPGNIRELQNVIERAVIMSKGLRLAAVGVVAGPGGAAAWLGIKRSTLQSRMQKLGIRLSRSVVSPPDNHCITAFSSTPHRSDCVAEMAKSRAMLSMC